METNIPRSLRCLAGLALSIWIASVFGEPSCTNKLALGMVITGSGIVGTSCALLLPRRPEGVCLPPRESLVAGVALGAFSSVVASTARIVFGLPPLDVAVSFASFTLGSVFTAVALLPAPETEECSV